MKISLLPKPLLIILDLGNLIISYKSVAFFPENNRVTARLF